MSPSLLLAALLAGAAVSASAQAHDFAMPQELNAAVLQSRALGAAAPAAVAAFRASAVVFHAARAATPINAGFLALGAAGKTGRVAGPPFGGDGSYRVIQNDASQMVFDMRTGYVQGRFTLKRDASTGQDTLGFDGRTKSGPFSGWTQCGGIYGGEITYDAGSDSGAIRWQFGGREVRDAYRGGRAGSRSMIITLKGHSHTFTQD